MSDLTGKMSSPGKLTGKVGSGGGGSGNVYSDDIAIIRVLDLSEYEALEVKDPSTLYLIKG